MNTAANSEVDLLTVRDLTISSGPRDHRHLIVDGLSLTIKAGETVAIVGESGSGKSMTAKALVGLLPVGVEAGGEVLYRGAPILERKERELRAIRGSQICLVFQDPFTMLNPLRPCGKQLLDGCAGMSRSFKRSRAGSDDMARRLAEVGIRDPGVARRYPFQLSGGMRQRVGIAAALAQDPELLIADEPSTALDVTTQKEVLRLLKSLQRQRGMSLVLITHDLRVAHSMCDRIYVMYGGSIVESSPATAMADKPLHPYSLALQMSEPPVDRRVGKLISLPGRVPTASEVRERCGFSGRCRWAEPVCVEKRPELREVVEGRWARCARLEDIAGAMAQEKQEAASAATHDDYQELGDVEPIVQVQNVQKLFRAGGRNVVGLDGVTIEFAPGESVGLVGESGSGKTTLARLLVSLEQATAGEIIIDGLPATDLRRLSAEERRHIRRTIQMVFQDPYSSLNPMRTVGDTLREALRAGGMKSSAGLTAEAANLLSSVGLPNAYARLKPVALSGGERQRVAVARALAVRPRVLVCDEPVSSLDVSVQAQVLNLLKDVRKQYGIAYLFITHDLAVVRQIADRVYVMYRGKIVEQGQVDDVLDRPRHEYTQSLVASVPRGETTWLQTDAQANGDEAGRARTPETTMKRALQR